MSVFSILRRSLPIKQTLSSFGVANGIQLRNCHKMYVTPSKWSWHKFKDMFHFYFMLGAIPLSALVMYVNTFVGPAQLAEIPEGHLPDNYEYYKHPISRWFAKHVYRSHQQEYEQFLHVMYEEHEKMEMTKWETKVYLYMHDKGDSTAQFYKAPVLDYMWKVRKDYEERREYVGPH